MKYSVDLRSCFLFSFLLLIISQTSCKKKISGEIKVNDYQTLAAGFKSPAAEYTTAPFFVWNYKITKPEIDNFLQEFKAQGSSQVFVHPRPGLITEYLSDEWFDLFSYTIQKGKELGMKIWIYDENSYPSGFAGGHVPDRMPESYNQGQGLRMTRFDVLPDTADKYFLCLKEENGKFTDITSTLASEKGKPGKFLLFNKTYNRKSDWYGGFSYVDLLYPGVTEKFLEVTMPGYEKSAGSEFGLTVPGIFTDEPQISSPSGIRWTPDLFDVFWDRWHYDLKTNLPSLFEMTGDWKRVRHNYTQTLLQLFIDRWAKPYSAYCEQKGLKFTGHYWEHSWPDMSNGGDNMAMYVWHQMPAIDMLFNQWNDSSPNAQFGNVRAVKELASAANQAGWNRKMSETYGGSGWELTFADMKKNGDWEYALGVNLMNQHLTYFSMAGARKYDYPPTFDYHEPWWNNYKYLNDHFARLSFALSAGRQINDILVLEPTTTIWLYDSNNEDSDTIKVIGKSFQNFVTRLEKNQVEYDLGSENIIKDRGSVENGKFVVGRCSYSTVVLPPMIENIDLETYKLLEKFVVNGGKIIAFSLPSLVNGAPSEGLNQFLAKQADKIIIESTLTDEVINRHFRNKDIDFTGLPAGSLYHHRRILADGQIVFIANSSPGNTVSGVFKVRGKGCSLLNTISGDITECMYTKDGEYLTVPVDLPPAGSMLVFINDRNTRELPVEKSQVEYETIVTDSQLIVKAAKENVLPLEFCDIELGGVLTKDMHTYNAADKIYKYYGFRNGNPWNTSVQFRTRTVDRDTFGTNTGFSATYHFTIKNGFDFSSMKAVIERPDLWQVTLNETEIRPSAGEWWLDREFSVFHIGSLVRKGDNVITLKTSPFRVHAEVEPVYITGDFTVNPEAKGWSIDAPAGSLSPGSWKEQGFPFYSWNFVYSKEFRVEDPEGEYIIELGKWSGTVSEVEVNGEKAGFIGFPPYRLDLTGKLRKGSNIISVSVTGSLKNLMGPHFNDPAPGLVSPWLFRNVKTYPAGKDYQLIDYGMFSEFTLLKSK
ncbi:MAG: hypothetical protein GX431_13755 [Bacteroidales bacterium]|jgi:hypothetical protein|nr:hypothetical protein [Bacteroidales bacterium]